MKPSCRHLRALYLPRYRTVDPREFRLKRLLHPRRPSLAESYTTDVGAFEPETAGNPAKEAELKFESNEVRVCHLSCESHNVALDSPKNYSYVNICQGESVAFAEPTLSRTLAEKIQSVRKSVLKMSQLQLSNRLGVSQSNVSKWESGTLRPETQHLMALANLLKNDVSQFYFMEAAGVPSGFFSDDPRYSEGNLPSEILSTQPPEPQFQVPLLRDSAAAGTTRAIEDGQIETFIPCLKQWMPRGSALVAVRVTGDSMTPLLQDGYVVVLDTAQRDAKKLVGKMVAARDSNGVTIKWLRRDNDLYMLVPQHTSPRFPISVLREEEGWGIVGAVVQWLGFPPTPKRPARNL